MESLGIFIQISPRNLLLHHAEASPYVGLLGKPAAGTLVHGHSRKAVVIIDSTP